MTDHLTEALQSLEWGANQDHRSAELTPPECQALLYEIDRLQVKIADMKAEP